MIFLSVIDFPIRESQGQDSARVLKMVRALRRTRPQVLVVPYWEERHPDHVETSMFAERAVFLAGLEEVDTSKEVYRPNMVVPCPIRFEASVSFLVDISEAAEGKYQLTDLYRSQVNPGAPGRATLFSSSLRSQALRARDIYLGSLIGSPAAEGDITSNAVSTYD